MVAYPKACEGDNILIDFFFLQSNKRNCSYHRWGFVYLLTSRQMSKWKPSMQLPINCSSVKSLLDNHSKQLLTIQNSCKFVEFLRVHHPRSHILRDQIKQDMEIPWHDSN